jgi:uncharacterized membrane protein YsdA (DUF1294 family)
VARRWGKKRKSEPSATGKAAGEDSPELAGTSDLDEKLKLAKDSYAEVLDATKHQDDKIGRLLTSVAFLTAATLALAGLSSATFVTREFSVPPYTLRLGLIALTVFLVGVVFTVMLLLTSLATPLRLPGLAQPGKRPPMRWIHDLPTSQIYFHEIARVSLQEWERKWEVSADELKEERLRSLVRETHNLGVRTSSKYDRTTEATALLSLSLLAFALAIVFVASAAGGPARTGPISLTLLHRVLIGGLIGAYCGLQLLARIRYNRQAIDESALKQQPKRLRLGLWGGQLYAYLLAALVFDVVVFEPAPKERNLWIALTVVLALATLCCFWLATSPEQTAGKEPWKNRRRRWTRRGVLTVITGGLAAVALYYGSKGWYVGQLAAASGAVLILILPSMLSPTLAILDRQRTFRLRNGGSTRPATPDGP